MNHTEQQTRTTIVQLLSHLGSQREVQQYLERFSDLERSRFAVIKVGGAIMRDQLDALVSSLAFLYRVGLLPIIVHGGGPQLDAALQDAGIENQRYEGLRTTTPRVLQIARKVFRELNSRLVNALKQLNVPAESITNGAFEAQHTGIQQLGLVGHIKAVDDHHILSALENNSIPVISTLGESDEGQILNINADEAAQHLVRHFMPYKVVFLTGPGGILDDNDEIIPSINLTTDYVNLLQQPWLHSGMRLKLQQIQDMLQALPPSVSVSITSPDQLPKELFTHKGSGTMVRKGERIIAHNSWNNINQDRLRELLEASFSGKLTEDYFNNTRLLAVYITESYRAAAVITQEQGHAKLDKFAVTDDARGEGLGRAVWNVMREQHPALYWRARRLNPINDFYVRQADGLVKGPQWHLFWCGEFEPLVLKQLYEHLQHSPATIIRNTPTETNTHLNTGNKA